MKFIWIYPIHQFWDKIMDAEQTHAQKMLEVRRERQQHKETQGNKRFRSFAQIW